MKASIAEIKARCLDPAAARQRLLSDGAVYQGRDHQVDTYFVTPHGRLKLRQGNIETNLIYYERENTHGPKDSRVLIHSPKDPESLRLTLSSALDILVVVDKEREIFWAENVKFHLDNVSGLGAFVEIEAIDFGAGPDRAELHRQCHNWLSRLSISDELMISTSYSDLLLVSY